MFQTYKFKHMDLFEPLHPVFTSDVHVISDAQVHENPSQYFGAVATSREPATLGSLLRVAQGGDQNIEYSMPCLS